MIQQQQYKYWGCIIMINKCWHCNNSIVGTDLFCSSCNHIQPVYNIDPFTLFGIPTFFEIDNKAIADIYFIRQRQLHPDRFILKSNKEKQYALAQVARLNEAYKILCNPVERASYLIKLSGWQTPVEENEKLTQQMMLEQFELREKLEKISDIKNLNNLKAKVENEVMECIFTLSKAFQDQQEVTAQCKTVELQFLKKFQNELENREKIIS